MQLIYDFGLRGPDGAWPNPLEANHAINCMDEERLTPEQGGELRAASYGQAPFMDPGVDVTEGARDGCEHWPAEPERGFPYAHDVEGLPDTLVVSITGDPTTPHGGAIELAETLGGALLTVEGEGRGIVSLGTNACVDEIAAAILSARAPMDVPTGFSSVAGRLSEADRAVLSICAMFDDDQAMKDLKGMIEAEPADLDHEINTLPPDASESTRQRLAERVAVILAEHQRNHPWMKDPEPPPTKSPAMVAEIAMRSVADLCNEAQRDVLYRAHILLRTPDPEG